MRQGASSVSRAVWPGTCSGAGGAISGMAGTKGRTGCAGAAGASVTEAESGRRCSGAETTRSCGAEVSASRLSGARSAVTEAGG